mgnify:CR=1 FL=1|tara:strand:+ start:1898 stop:2773 length:876 start_codon:yes stop_codon:yes gene_type:complete
METENILYTDGSCIGNPGPGGWASIIIINDIKTTLSGSDEKTTNNKMEITAVIKGLEQFPENSSVKIFTDSEYVINTMTKNWKRNTNLDLWNRLDSLVVNRTIEWNWVKGHSGNKLNDEADLIANGEAKKIIEKKKLTHLNKEGNAQMVDTSTKGITERIAIVSGKILMKKETLDTALEGNLKKGDLFSVAKTSGINAAKWTHLLIPMCHPIPVSNVVIDIVPNHDLPGLEITSTVKANWNTGVEMEAFTAVSITCLTIFDMCKSLDKSMKIEDIHLVHKAGGASGEYIYA